MPRRPGATVRLGPPAPPSIHLARDHTSADVRARLRTGEWIRVRRGAYLPAPPADDPTDRRDLPLALIAALSSQLTTPFVFSHASAALLWGLPTWPESGRAHITQPSLTSGPDRDFTRHVRPLAPDERTTVNGLPVTTLERTVVDCTTTIPPRWGLVVADAALHAGVVRAACLRVLEQLSGHRGVVKARAVLELADDGAESPGESLVRFVVLRAGLPAPQTQVPIDTQLGRFWSDLGWPEWRLLAEYDGRAKYESGGAASEVVLGEKRRQDAIEEVGYRMLRISAADVRQADSLVRRVLRLAPPGTASTIRPRPALLSR